MRARHPEEFYMRLKVEDNRKRKGYENAELTVLADAEVDLNRQTPDTSIKFLLRWEESNERVSRSVRCASVQCTKSLCKN